MLCDWRRGCIDVVRLQALKKNRINKRVDLVGLLRYNADMHWF